jgi:hypothetical protein
MSFQFLPQTIIHHIAMYLDPTDLASFNMVSKSNRNKLNDEEFWQR